MLRHPRRFVLRRVVVDAPLRSVDASSVASELRHVSGRAGVIVCCVRDPSENFDVHRGEPLANENRTQEDRSSDHPSAHSGQDSLEEDPKPDIFHITKHLEPGTAFRA
jgi:hypothetical protein